ncbi:MAG: adenylyltransferase/cytidyltransferase family protein [Patescibacteria group bacterium]|jgi:FAD synthetase
MRKRVLVFGTFDVLHPGHVRFLTAAAKFGSVMVALTPDTLVTTYKGRPPVNSYSVREGRLRDMAVVTDVVAADNTPNTYDIIEKLRPEVLVLGYDQTGLRATITKKLSETEISASIRMIEAYRSDVYRSSRLRALAEKTISTTSAATV